MNRGEWEEKLRALGDAEGFYAELSEHTALYVERGDTLVVTFENLDHVYEHGPEGLPWAYDFVASRGWSMLGLMAHAWTWYRSEDVIDFFDRLRDEGFFARFSRVVFYGASMGAYAAAAYSAAAPGATVVLISPQATLSRDVAPWETRYRKAWRRDFSGPYGYAPDMVEAAEKVYLFYDPTAPLDAMHAALFRGAAVEKMPCRYLGHRIASMWAQMGVLKPVVEQAIDGTLTRKAFNGLMRARMDTRRYHLEMLERVQLDGRPWLIAHWARGVLERAPGPRFRQALRKAERAMAPTPPDRVA